MCWTFLFSAELVGQSTCCDGYLALVRHRQQVDGLHALQFFAQGGLTKELFSLRERVLGGTRGQSRLQLS